VLDEDRQRVEIVAALLELLIGLEFVAARVCGSEAGGLNDLARTMLECAKQLFDLAAIILSGHSYP